jgi:hypothetical protein
MGLPYDGLNIEMLLDEIKSAHDALDMIGGRDRKEDGTRDSLANRIGKQHKDWVDQLQLWDECFQGHLTANCGVKDEDIKAAEEWANHVISK